MLGYMLLHRSELYYRELFDELNIGGEGRGESRRLLGLAWATESMVKCVCLFVCFFNWDWEDPGMNRFMRMGIKGSILDMLGWGVCEIPRWRYQAGSWKCVFRVLGLDRLGLFGIHHYIFST